MALDTNIALGVKPIEQPNMLAQMGQMMQMRQMQQGYESENALRDFYAQGGDLSTAEGRRQLMSRAPMQGQKLIGQQSEIAARDIGTAEKSLELYKNQVGFIKSPEDAARWLSNFYANPTTRPYVESVAPMDVALAAIPKNDPAAFQAWLRNASLKAEKLFVDANTEATNKTRIQAANIGAAAPLGQLELARAKEARSQQELGLVRDILTGGPTTSTAPSAAANAPMGGGSGRLGSGTFNIPMGGGAQPPVTGAVTQPNILATQVGPPTTFAPNVNASNPNVPSRVNEITRQLTQLARVGGPVANQAMEGLVKEYNVLNPAGKIELGQDGVLRVINERSGTAKVVIGDDGQPVSGKVAPVTKDIVDPTDPSGRRMITVEVNTYKAGTGLGVDGTQAAPAGVLGVATSQIPAGYMRDPNNPQGVIAVPGNAATDPKAAALLRGPRAGYKYNDAGEEVRIPQTGVPEGVRIKPGERWSEEKQMIEQIPGSSAFIEQQKKHGADLNAVKTAQTSTKWGTGRIDKILAPENKKGFENNFGGFTAYGTKEFSGNTALVKTEIDSLKSDLKNRGLQIIRSGGSIGAITEKEWPIIESMIATLSPKMDIKDARELLEEVRAKFEALENLAAEKYNDQWQNTQYHKPVETRRTAPSSGGGVDATNKFLQ